MDKIKKISGLIAAIYIIAACVILPAFADEVTTSSDTTADDPSLIGEPITWSYPLYAFTGYLDTSLASPAWVYSRQFVSPTTSGDEDISSLPSAWLRSSFSGGTSNGKSYFGLGLTGTLSDSNGFVTSLEPGYSYRVMISVEHGWFVSQYNPNQAVPLIDSYEFWATNNNPTSAGFPSGLFPLSSFFDDYSQSMDRISQREVAGNYGSWIYITEMFTCVFHIPDDDENGVQALNYLSFFEMFDNSANPLNSVQYQVQYVDLTGVYDPGGGDIDDLESEAQQIIAGQVAAAQYALDQEKAENEAALEGALDNADTSGLSLTDTFGASLTNLYNAITYTGSSFNIKLPASGTVPLLNTQLWDETDIPIKDYIDKVPSVVWVVINFLLWFMVVRAVIKLVHKIIDLIGGGSGD